MVSGQHSNRSINHCSLIVLAVAVVVAVLVVGVSALMKLLASEVIEYTGVHKPWPGNSNKISVRFPLPTFPQLPENVCQIGCRRRIRSRSRRRTATAFHGHGQIEYTDLGRPFVAAPNEKRSRDCVPQLLVRLGIICVYANLCHRISGKSVWIFV